MIRFCVPSDIEVLLHFHIMGTPHPRADAPAVKDAIRRFIAAEIIRFESESVEDGITYVTTERGKAWVLALCCTPYPEQVWMDGRGRPLYKRLMKEEGGE